MRTTVVAVTGSAVALVVALYLPWQEYSAAGTGQSFPFVFQPANLDGWMGIGAAAGLLAILVALGGVAALLGMPESTRLPLGELALLAGFYGVANLVQAHLSLVRQAPGGSSISADLGAGAYVGGVAAAALLVAGAVLARPESIRYGPRLGIVATGLVLGLLGVLLLPWSHVAIAPVNFHAIEWPATVGAAAFAVALGAIWSRDDARTGVLRLGLAVATVVCLVPALRTQGFGEPAYGAWIGVGIALMLIVLSVADLALARTFRLPDAHGLAIAGTAGSVVAALFLPWEKTCVSAAEASPTPSCFSTTGWDTDVGAAAGFLALAAAIVALAFLAGRSLLAELAVATAVFVATLAFELGRQNRSYGVAVAVAAAAALVLASLLALRGTRPDGRRLLTRLLPVGAAAAYVALVVVPWWDVLPNHLEHWARVGSPSWLMFAAVVGAVWIAGLWIRQTTTHPPTPRWLAIAPLILLALTAAEVVRLHDDGFSAGRAAALGLCLALAALGRVECREGIEAIRVPAALRADRL